IVAKPIEENRELVAAQPREHITRAQARFEAARDRCEQFVSHHVTEAVVDHFESIEIQVESRESRSAALLLELAEPVSEPLDEHRAIAETGERIAETGIVQLFTGACLVGRVGERTRDANRAPARSPHGNALAEEAAIRPILVPDPVLVLEAIGFP